MSEFQLGGFALVLVIIAVILVIVAVVSFIVAAVLSKNQKQQNAAASAQAMVAQQQAAEAARAPGVVAVSAEVPAATPAPTQSFAPAPTARAAAAPAATQSFAPAPAPAAPAPSVTPPPAFAPSPAQDSQAPADFDDRTQVAPRSQGAAANQGWTLVEVDGAERIQVQARAVVVGRSPSSDGLSDVDVRGISDPMKSVSKTHALLRSDQAGVLIEDLNSTNGVYLVQGSDEVRIDAAVPTLVPAGDQVLIGDRRFVVERSE